MLEYDIDEAQALLETNLSTASRNLETLEEDLDFLRDQFTTTEVSILPPECVCLTRFTWVRGVPDPGAGGTLNVAVSPSGTILS